MNEMTEELRTFAEAMLDVDRLKIVGGLARGIGGVESLAVEFDMAPETVLTHLQRLSETGLVSLQPAEDGAHAYRITAKVLEDMARRQFKHAKTLQSGDPDRRVIGGHFTAQEADVIRRYTLRSGEIPRLPSLRKPELLEIVLRYALQGLEFGRTYTEKEVNRVFARFSRDTAFIRRYLFDLGYIDRKPDGSEYRRVEGRK